MTRGPSSALRTLALAVAVCAARPPSAAAQAADTCPLASLPGLSAQISRAVRESRVATASPAGVPSRLAPGPAADLDRVVRAVLGASAESFLAAVAAPQGSPGEASGLPVACGADVRARDLVAWRLTLGGYSAREIADVVDGHLTPADLDEARRRLMAGQPRPVVAAFLDARWRTAGPEAGASPASAAIGASPLRAWPDLGALDREVVTLAAEHRVAANLVRAVIAAESGGNAAAVSPAGAIGLMQLMPATAAALGVNPWRPRENLRGGVAYLASLLRAFDGDPRLALIAYNAGPQHARDVRDGRAVAYRETRRYLDAVDARFPLPAP